MTPQQIRRYEALMKRREQLLNFIYVAELPLTFFGGQSLADMVMLDQAIELARNTIIEIEKEIAKL